MANIVNFWKNAIIHSRNVVPKFDNLFLVTFYINSEQDLHVYMGIERLQTGYPVTYIILYENSAISGAGSGFQEAVWLEISSRRFTAVG